MKCCWFLFLRLGEEDDAVGVRRHSHLESHGSILGIGNSRSPVLSVSNALIDHFLSLRTVIFYYLQSTFLRPTHSLTRSPTHALTSPSAHSHSYARSATSTCTHSRTNTRKHTLIEHINLSPTHALAFPRSPSRTRAPTFVHTYNHTPTRSRTKPRTNSRKGRLNIKIY